MKKTAETMLEKRIQSLEKENAELKEREKKLRHIESRFHELFNNMSSGVAIYEAVENGNDFVFVDFNKAGEKIEKIKRNQIIGKKVTEIFPGVSEFGLLDVLRKVWYSGKPELYPVSYYKDGRIEGWRENYIFKLPSAEIVAVYDDLTKSKRTEDALQKSEKKFRSLFVSMTEGVCFHEIIHNKSGKAVDYIILDVNPAYESSTGLKKKTVVGKRASEVYGTGEPPFIKEYNTVIRSGKSLSFEAYFAPMKKHFRILVFSANKKSFVTIFSDISEYIRQNEEIQKLNRELEERVFHRTSELESANKDLQDFVYSVSHDLRAPLRSISGFAEIINRRHKSSLNEEGKEYFGYIVDASKQMGLLIDDLLRYSRLGHKAVKNIPIDLNEMLSEIADKITASHPEKNIVIEIQKGFPLIQSDETLLQQIFSNLLDNAVKYHRKDVKPMVRVNWKKRKKAYLFLFLTMESVFHPNFIQKYSIFFSDCIHRINIPGQVSDYQ